jgi:maternal embryonic leucine zipper kinase
MEIPVFHFQDDLPRVTTELEALKHLAHQNICRLFQYVETEEKFYIVMEVRLF